MTGLNKIWKFSYIFFLIFIEIIKNSLILDQNGLDLVYCWLFCVENCIYLHTSIIFLFSLTSSATSDFPSLEIDFASSQWLWCGSKEEEEQWKSQACGPSHQHGHKGTIPFLVLSWILILLLLNTLIQKTFSGWNFAWIFLKSLSWSFDSLREQ